MSRTRRAGVRFLALVVLALLIATPGVHLFELFLAPSVAFWLSHALALLVLAVVAWRWQVARARA